MYGSGDNGPTKALPTLPFSLIGELALVLSEGNFGALLAFELRSVASEFFLISQCPARLPPRST